MIGRPFRDRLQQLGSPPLLLFGLFVALTFMLGGGARDDLQSLLLLRPLGAAAFVGCLYAYAPALWPRHRMLLSLTAAVMGLIVLHLIPLPPALWTALPGRGVLVDIYAAAGMDLPWLPLSFAPDSTWNALFAAMIPVAALLMALNLPGHDHVRAMRLILIIGLISSLLGLMQAIGPAGSPLYFYAITNEGSAVGLFANRNHQALLLSCLFPMLAAHVRLLRVPEAQIAFHRRMALAAAALLVPLILVTGSRAGLVSAALGMALAWWLYLSSQTVQPKGGGVRAHHLVGVLFAVLALVMISVASGRAVAIDRLFGPDSADDLRTQALPTLWQITLDMAPFGSGIGSFAEVYKLYEPDTMLTPQYFNHAHNDFVEVVMTAGLPGALLLGWALALLAYAAVRLIRARSGPARTGSAFVLGRLGVALGLLLAFGSITDYPLRVPSLALLAAFAAACAAIGLVAARNRDIAPLASSARHS